MWDRVNVKLLKQRAEMLDAVSTGLHPAAVIGQLAGKYAGFCEMVEQRLNAVQKAAWSIYPIILRSP